MNQYTTRQSAPPPPDLAQNGKSILTIAGVFTSFACLAAILRFYVRIFMLKSMGIDDYLMGASVICSAAVFACFVGEVNAGVGDHISNPQLLANFGTILHYSYYHALLLVSGVCLAKMSVGFFLLRLVQGVWYRRFITGWIIFLVIFTLASLGTLIFQCIPVNAAWDFTLRPTANCYSTTTFRNIGLANGSVNIFTDFVFATLPIPFILPLQVNVRTKASLIFILSLGYFACAASIVKEVLLYSFFKDTDSFYHYTYQIWNDLEINIGILAACLPALRPLFAFILGAADSVLNSSSRKRTNTGGARHRYYVQDDDIKLGSLQSRNQQKAYGVTVSGGKSSEASATRSRNMPSSKLEAAIDENNSEENILPLQYPTPESSYKPPKDKGVITRTTEVFISR